MSERILLAMGDYCAGGAVGGLTGLAVRAVVQPEFDMVIAMLVGMAVGTVVHLAVGLCFAPFLGMFHTMIPGGLIGMYGGMAFGMRDTMPHAGSTGRAIAVGIAFGVVVTAAMQAYDWVLRSTSACGRGA